MTLRVLVNALSHQCAKRFGSLQPNGSYGAPTADGVANGRTDRRHHSSVVGDEPAVLDQKRFRKEQGLARFAEAPLLV
jgi:hypothetical protein